MKKDGVKQTSRTNYDQIKISAHHIADSINLKQFKADFTGKLVSSSSSELFYEIESGYIYIFNYGNVAFANITDVEKSKILKLLLSYTLNPIQISFSDDFRISHFDETKPRFDFDDMFVHSISQNLIKTVMFNVAQSVALDFYAHESEMLLEKVNSFASQLESKGRITLSKRNMMKFIGLTLNRKNRIIDNLYIFDVPEIVWEDKILDEINTGMIKLFDLRTRFKEVQSNFKNIEENLSIFMELYQHRMSNMLEWIIIVLILIEVLDLFITKLKPFF